MIKRRFAPIHIMSSRKTLALATLLAATSTNFVTNAKANDQQVQTLIKEVIPCLTDIADNSTRIIQEKTITEEDVNALEESTLMRCKTFLPTRALITQVISESERVDETKQIKNVIENNLNIANQILDIEIAGDELNTAIAQRNPSINISIDYTIKSQNYWKCANNEYLEIGVTCSTVDGLRLKSSDSSSSSSNSSSSSSSSSTDSYSSSSESSDSDDPTGASFAAPFNYGQIGSLDSNAIEFTYDILNIEQDRIIQAKRESLKKTQSSSNYNSKKIISDTTQAIDENAVLNQELIIYSVEKHIYEVSLDYYQRLLKTGLATKLDTQKVDAKISKAEANIRSTQSALAQNRAKIKILLSQTNNDVNESLYIDNPYAEIPWNDKQFLLSNALKTNPQLLALNYEIESLRYQAKAEGSATLPKINVFLGMSPQFTQVYYKGPRLKSFATGFTGGLGMNWKVFDSGESRSQKSATIKKAEQKINEYKQLIIKLDNDINALSHEIEDGKVQIDSQHSAVMKQFDSAKDTELRLKYGFEDVTSLIQTIDFMIQTQLGLARSIHKQKTRYFNLALASNYFGGVSINKWVDQSLQESKESSPKDSDQLNSSETE